MNTLLNSKIGNRWTVRCETKWGLVMVLASLLCLLRPEAAQAQSAWRKAFIAIGRTIEENPKATAVAVGVGATAITYTATSNYINSELKTGEYLYSLDMNLDANASAIYWSRVFSRPNLTGLVQVEGMGEYWIPQVYPAYKGGSILWSFIGPKIPAGRKVNVVVFDDQSDQNAILNGLMRMKMRPSLEGKVNVSGLVRASLRGETTLQLLSDDVPDLPLISIKPVCAYSVTCPNPWFGWSSQWATEGTVTDLSNKPIGQISLKQLGGK